MFLLKNRTDNNYTRVNLLFTCTTTEILDKKCGGSLLRPLCKKLEIYTIFYVIVFIIVKQEGIEVNESSTLKHVFSNKDRSMVRI
jgi:hypothetical protein